MSDFNQALADIYKVIHPINAKNVFVTYLNKTEKPLLEKNDLITLKLCVQKLKKLLDWKKQQILGLVTKANKIRIDTFIDEMKKDTRTMMIIKKAICSEIIKKFKTEFSGAELKTNPVYAGYNQYLLQLNWLFQEENTIITHIVESLEQVDSFAAKREMLDKIKPAVMGKIKDKGLNHYANVIFNNWSKYYTFMINRTVPVQVEAGQSEETHQVHDEALLLHEEEEADLLTGKQDDKLNLPDFGEEDDAFIDKLAEMDNADKIVREINTLAEEKQEQIITELSFDPRFDTIFEEIVHLKGDMGEFLGSLMKKVKDIEKKYGYTASEDFLNDLIARIKAEKGADHLLVNKIRNCLNNLMAIHERTTRKLTVLKKQLAGKSILDQVKVLQDKAKDKTFKGIFGAVRNLERIALENHFEEIFTDLPIELQKVVGEGFMSDLKELKAYYPDLLKKLEKKLLEVNNKFAASYVSTHDVDYALIDKILDTLPGQIDSMDSMEDLLKITASIQGDSGGSEDYKNLGVLMAGDKKHTPADLLVSLEKQNKHTNKSEQNRIDQIIGIIGEIEKIPGLNEKISTIHFWLDKHLYSDQPDIENFLQGQLEALEQKKIREGGLIRNLFDELEKLNTTEAKTRYLESMLDNPEYVHLKAIIRNLIENVKTGITVQKSLVSEQLIYNEIEKLAKLEDKVNWLKIRKTLPVFETYGDFMDQTIKEIENRESKAVMEKLEDKLTLSQANDKVKQKQVQGEKPVIHENIIALTRAVLKLDSKLERRKMILEQESVHPLAENNLFHKQRRLLFYLLNTEPGEKPGAMVKALAEKMLLTREEKTEYLKILKTTKFKSGAEILTLQEELGIDADDLAYYAADILAWEKQSPERKLDYFEKLRDGKIQPAEITFIAKNGEQARQKYLDFFGIHFQIINMLIVYYRKLAKPKKEAEASTGVSMEIPSETALPADEPESEAELPEFPAEEKPGKLPEPGALPGAVPANHKNAKKPETPQEKPGKVTDNDKKETGKKEAGRAETTIEEENRVSADITRPGTDAYNLYIKNRNKIDESVKKQIEVMARDKYQDVEERIKGEIVKAEKEFKRNTGSKIQSIIRNLNACQPEIIAELINHTIIPALSEAGDTDTMDLIAVLNQNLFSPTLYSGADIDAGNVVRNIESFLHVDGIFKDCFDDLVQVVEKLKAIRGKFINTVVEKELHQISALNTAARSGDIEKILKNLLKLEPAIQIIAELENNYIIPLKDNPGQKNILSRLEFVKQLITTAKKIDWGSGNAFNGNTQQMIVSIREKYQEALHTSPAVQNTGAAAGKKSNPVEKELINAKTFVNPQQYIKAVLKEHKIEMTNEAREELVNRMAEEGRIFSYDKKLYIGYGTLNGYLNDKDNIGYSKNRLAGELIKFLGRFQDKKDKAAFVGIAEGEFDEFHKKMEYWSTHSDAAMTEHKPQTIKRSAMKLKKVHEAEPAEKKRAKPGKAPALPAKQKPGKAKQKTPAKAPAKASAEHKDLLAKLHKMITDKLLFLIKESESKQMLSMLYSSYLDPKAKKGNLFVLIDKDKYQKLYDSIKEDQTIHDKLSFDIELVKQAYKKRLARIK